MDGKDDGKDVRRKAGKGAVPPTIDLTAQDVSPPVTPPEAAGAEEAKAAPDVVTPQSASVADIEARYGQKFTPKVEPRVPPPPPPPQSPSSGFAMLTALGGGLAGAAIVFGLASAGLFTPPQPTRTDQSETLAPQIAGLQDDVAALRSSSDANRTGLSTVNATLKSLSDTSDKAAGIAAEAKNVADTTAQKLADLPSAPPATMPVAPAPPPVDLSPITSRLDKVETSALSSQAAIGPLQDTARQIITANERLASVEKMLTEGSRDRTAAYAVALGELTQAMRSGVAFEPELAAVRAVSGDDKALAVLSPLANKGVPTNQQLADGFDAVSPKLVAALLPKAPEAPADAGMLNRLWFSFANSGTVTREGEPSADALAAPVHKVAQLLRQGDLGDALATFATLPAPVQQLAADWQGQARLVFDARTSVRDSLIATLQKLSRP